MCFLIRPDIEYRAFPYAAGLRVSLWPVQHQLFMLGMLPMCLIAEHIAINIQVMTKLVFGMNQSLDGYVNHMAFATSPTLFRHFIEEAQGQAGSVYGRKMYEVGPNVTLVESGLEGAIRKLKNESDGEMEVAGPDLAKRLTELGLIDEYRIYLHPVVLGDGRPYFAGPRPPLRLKAHDRICDDVLRLTYIPA